MMKKFFVKCALVICALSTSLIAMPYAPPDNVAGTTAVSLDDARISHWAGSSLRYEPGEDVDARWRDTANALGVAEGNAFDITCLGRGGEIVLVFDPPIQNGVGDDFAVFENSFSRTFLELAFVEVSNDGVNFQRFANDSLTTEPVGGGGSVDATQINGLAGKYRGGFGTPFDIAELGLATVKYVRLVDVVGGTSLDSSGDVIYDPWPTFGSAGFDLDGVAVLNADLPKSPPEVLSSFVEGNDFIMTWRATVGERYRIESVFQLGEPWMFLEEKIATSNEEELRISMLGSPRRFFRIGR